MRPCGVPLILLIVLEKSVLVQFDCHSFYNNDGGVKGIGERRRFWVLKKRHFALYGVLTFSRGPRLAH
jgi:hypothetical protein